jgi:hypothetical protein
MGDKYIFYLNFDGVLPDFYYTMAEQFSHQGITLVPLKPEQLPSFINQQEMTYAICPTIKLDHIKKFKIKLKRILKSALNNNTLTIYHLGSFDRLNLSKTNIISKNYYWLQLPIKVETLVKYLSKHYLTYKSRKLTWPGGKRSTLPAAS